jgi:uncharacterized protein YbcI
MRGNGKPPNGLVAAPLVCKAIVREGKSCGKTQRARGILVGLLAATPRRLVPGYSYYSAYRIGERVAVSVAIDPDSPQPEGPEDPGRPEDAREPPTRRQVRDEIAREILRIYEESYGTGAKRAEALVSESWVIVVLDGLELLPNEKFLVENGKQDTVLQVRSQYQQAIRSSFSAAIERATGRTVIGFSSTTSVEEPRFMAEIFRLE